MVALRLWVRFIVNIDHYPPICIRMYIYRRADIAEKAHGWGRYYYLVPVFIMSISPRDIRTVVFLQQKIPCQSLWSHCGNVKFNSGKSSLFSSVSPDGWRE